MSQFTARLFPTAPLSLALAVLLAAALLFAVAFDQGQLAHAVQAAAGDEVVHEVFHGAGHMLGCPCQ